MGEGDTLLTVRPLDMLQLSLAKGVNTKNNRHWAERQRHAR